MSELLARDDLNRFRAAIASQIGLMFDDSKLGFLGEVMSRRLDALRCPADAYLRTLERAASAEEISALADPLTVTETYFFRCQEQFQTLAEFVLPSRMRARSLGKSLRLLSAGCASGEEPYSLAIVASDTVTDPEWQIDIRAVDVNPLGLEKARRATYSPWALRETTPEVQKKWFRQVGRDFVLAPAIRDAVRFEVKNLANADFDLWRPAAYDVIFCRNVMMYFTPPQIEALVARLALALAPGGYLFLGHAETLRGVSEAFHLRHTHETFYYERKDGEYATFSAESAIWRSTAAAPPSALPADSWVDAIRAATDRIESLTLCSLTEAAGVTPTRPVPDLALALDLVRRERFAEALSHVANVRTGQEDDPDLLLLEAALLVQNGNLREAETTARHLLEIDEINAGAHYVLALATEQASDARQAAEHDRIAISFDPSFAMPYLHLGLLAKRGGDRARVRRALGQAKILLHREDASRILLFGGGFSREALIALCESALCDQDGTL